MASDLSSSCHTVILTPKSDPPFLVFGYQLPDVPDYNPLADLRFTSGADRFHNFCAVWIGGFYDQHDTSTGRMNDLDMRPSALRNSVDTWSAEQYEKWVEEDAAARCEPPMYVSWLLQCSMLAY